MNAASLVTQTHQKVLAGRSDENYDYAKIRKERLIEYRKAKTSIVPLEKPTNIPRAKELGYKAKEGITVVRVRVRKGSGMHVRLNKGRRPKRHGVTKLTRRKSIKSIGEERVQRKHPNMEVLNSYKVGMDGKHHYYEVILIDPFNKAIIRDKDLKWICEPQHKKRVHRGHTSAAKKGRGLRKKGTVAIYARPSLRANDRRAK